MLFQLYLAAVRKNDISYSQRRRQVEKKECPFCKLDPERNPILWEGEGVVMLLSNPRLAPWHTLVVPRRHVSHLWDLSRSELEGLISIAVAFQERLIRAFSEQWESVGCDLRQNDRSFMPTDDRSVPEHLHFHLIPRTWQDALYEMVSKYVDQRLQKALVLGSSRADRRRRKIVLRLMGGEKQYMGWHGSDSRRPLFVISKDVILSEAKDPFFVTKRGFFAYIQNDKGPLSMTPFLSFRGEAEESFLFDGTRQDSSLTLRMTK